MPGIKFDTTVETAKVVSGFRDIQNAIHQTAEKAEKEGKSIDDVISNIQNSLNIAIGGWSIGKFVNQMMQVRGQFQQTEMAFKTMLQSEEKANELMKQMIHTAAITPFGVEDVTEGAKQLLAFNVAAEDVNKTLIGLGDVAAGMGLNLKDLVMLYGTTIAKGKMDTMDLYQFLNRGIPIADEIAKVMGLDVTNAIKEVQKQIKEGKVTSDIFIQAMQSMTAEGSKFGGLMEAQSKTITGQISNIEDSIEQMFNELGKSQEGVINSGLGIMSYLADNWKSVGKAVMVAATAYGTYKAVLMTVTALQILNNRILQQAVVEKTLAAAAGINLSNAEAVAAARTKFLTLAQKGLTVALKETAKATLLNPYVLLAAAITSVVVAIYSYVNRISSAEAAENALAKSLDDTNQKLDDRNQKLQDLIRIIQSVDSTDLQKQLAFDELSKLAPSITDVYDSVEKLAKADLSQLNQQLNELSDEKREESLKSQVEELKKLYKDLESFSISGGDNDGRFRGAIAQLKNQFGLDLGWAANSQDWKDAVSDLMAGLQKQLFDIEEAKKKIAEPTKIDIELAKDKYEQSKEQLDYLSKFALAMKNDIEHNPTKVPFDGGEADRVIAELEKKADELKQEQIKNPIQFTADKQKALEKYQELIADIKWWKSKNLMQGTFTIPVEIQFKMKQLEGETQKAKENFNYLTGKYEEANKDESYAAAKKQAKIDYQAAVKAEKEARKGSNKDWEKAKADLDNKKKEYEKYWGSISASKKVLSDAKKTAEDQRKAQEELNEKLKSLQQENTDENISLMQEGTEKKLAEIKNDYAKRKAEIDKQESEFKKKNKEAGKKATLTSAQSNALNKARDLATQEYNKKLDDVNRDALTSMRDYLKEYGSLYQQKQAIADEYEEKIAKAQTQGEKLSLQQQKKKELQDIEINAIRQNIDWGSIFGDFGAMFKDQLKPTIEKLQELSKSTTDVNEQKTIQELISKLQGSATVWDSDIFKKVSDDINAYQSAMQGYIDAQERETEATKAVTNAQEDLAKAKKGGDKTNISKAEGDLSRAQNVLATASNEVLKFGSSVQKASSDLQTSSQKAVSQFQQLENGLQGLTSGSLKGIGDSILGLDKLFGGTMQKDVANTIAKGIQGLLGKDSNAAKVLTEALGDSGMAGEIISAVLGILDILKDGFGTLISSLIDTVLGAVTGILDDILSGDIVMKPLKSIGNNVSHILNTLSFGGFNSLFGGNGKKVQEAINDLTSSNERLQKSIDKLKDTMTGTYGKESTNAYKEAIRQQQTYNGNVMEIAKQQMSYWGSHKSWNHYWSGFSDEQMKKIRENVKSDFNGDLTSLTPEEMKKLLSYQDLVGKIRGTGKHYKGRSAYGESVLGKLEDYADLAGNLDELTEQWRESITQISFDSMKDNFVSNLMDMSKSAQDFSDDFAEMMQKALLSYSMGDLINVDLKKLYDDWADAIDAANGDSSKIDIDAFNKRYDDIVQEGLKRRDDWAKVTGYTGSSSSQTATSGGWASMGQETADELNGRFTALQIAGESIAQNMTTTISQMESIVTLGISTNGAVLEIRNMMIMTNSYLEDIAKYSKLTYNDFGSKLDDMNRRLKEI